MEFYGKINKILHQIKFSVRCLFEQKIKYIYIKKIHTHILVHDASYCRFSYAYIYIYQVDFHLKIYIRNI